MHHLWRFEVNELKQTENEKKRKKSNEGKVENKTRIHEESRSPYRKHSRVALESSFRVLAVMNVNNSRTLLHYSVRAWEDITVCTFHICTCYYFMITRSFIFLSSFFNEKSTRQKRETGCVRDHSTTSSWPLLDSTGTILPGNYAKR